MELAQNRAGVAEAGAPFPAPSVRLAGERGRRGTPDRARGLAPQNAVV